jgi:hypothetical protein
MRVLPSPVAALAILLLLIPMNLHAATFTVVNTNDAGPGSLRQAMLSANANGVPDVIDFNIPGPGPYVIRPLSALPMIMDSGTFIDGFTQVGPAGAATPGVNPPSTAQLLIELDGSLAGASHGIHIMSSDNTVQGLNVYSWGQDGIRADATLPGTSNNFILCNFVGTDVTGTVPQGNGWTQTTYWAGIKLVVPPGSNGLIFDNFIERNLSSDNYTDNVSLSSCPPGDLFNNVVFGNYLGTDITGMNGMTPYGANVYIGEGAHDNSADSNVICANRFGVSIVGYSAIGVYTYANEISCNAIGVAADWLTPLGNLTDGVQIGLYGAILEGYAPDNHVVGNTIAWNGAAGVVVCESSLNNFNTDGNWIESNMIFENGALGIDLANDGVTPNDPGDPDGGPNEEVNFPVIATAYYYPASGTTVISGSLDVPSPNLATVEVFKARRDPTNYGEGEVFLSQAMPDAAGSWTVTVWGLAIGDSVTATATDIGSNTSEFSECVVVVPGPGVGVDEKLASGSPGISLEPCFPNPFSTMTEIRYSLAATADVRLEVYDVSGRLVRVLVRGNHEPSHYVAHWDGRDESGRDVASGTYFVCYEAGGKRISGKVLLVR